MYSRRQFLLGVGGLAATLGTRIEAQDGGFDAFRQQQLGAFQNYQETIQREFAAYQRVTEEAFNAYRRSVNRLWGDQEVGSPTRWVEYAPDMRTRTIVDFEQGVIHVEALSAAEAPTRPVLERALQGIANKTVGEAYRDDQLSQQIEQQVKQVSRHLETGRPDGAKMIASALTGTPRPDPGQVQQALARAVVSAPPPQVRRAPQAGMQVQRLSVPFNPAHLSQKAAQYRPIVDKYAAMEKISPALVLAIMHSESSFNPLAKSHIPAFGLMQIVPRSAGMDATQKIYGQQRLLAPSYLYNADNNIKMGCAYLNILYYRYLQAISNPESRLYCTIAAYNTGAGNVARAFSGARNVKDAAPRINRMPPDQVYQHLLQHLPYEETRRYLQKVLPRYQGYLRQ